MKILYIKEINVYIVEPSCQVQHELGRMMMEELASSDRTLVLAGS